jgi:hypothetical protein
MRLLLLISFLLVGLLVQAQKGIRESCDITSPPVIDGVVTEWTNDWNLDGESKTLYTICNDLENLYIRLKFSDHLTQRKIGLYGLYLKIDVNGKKKGKLGIKYPVGKDVSELKKEKPVELPDQASLDAYKRQLLSDVEVIELLGLAKESIVSSRLGLMNGIQVFIAADAEANYIYEAKIPFKAFNIDKQKSPILGITIETGRQTVNNQPNGGAAQPPQQGGFGQRSFGGTYSVMSIPAYMWVGVKLK